MKKNGKISQSAFCKRLAARSFEDIDLIDFAEKYLVKKRSYFFDPPTHGDSVILLYSGGLDSTVAWAWLMHTFKLHVYPLVVGDIAWLQGKSIDFYSNLFKQRYPELWHKPFRTNASFFSKKAIKDLKDPKKMSAAYFLRNVCLKTMHNPSLSGSNSLAALSALFYAQWLNGTQDLGLKTILSGVLASDGNVIPTQSYTYLCKTALFLHQQLSNYDVQFGSIFFNKQMGHFFGKSDVIVLGSKELKLDLSKTHSCSAKSWVNCGACLSCYSRKLEFEKAGVVDKTVYFDSMKMLSKIINKINRAKRFFSPR